MVAVVHGSESKCLEMRRAERLFNTLQFIVAALIIHLAECHKIGQQEEPLQSADWGYGYDECQNALTTYQRPFPTREVYWGNFQTDLQHDFEKQ